MNFKIEFWEIVLIIFGFIFAILLVGYGIFLNKVSETKDSLPEIALPINIGNLNITSCVEITSPKNTSHTFFPASVSGVVSNCGWKEQDGSIGTMVVLDSKGQAISGIYNMQIIKKEGQIYTFSKTVHLNHLSSTKDGMILFRSIDEKNAYVYKISF